MIVLGTRLQAQALANFRTILRRGSSGNRMNGYTVEAKSPASGDRTPDAFDRSFPMTMWLWPRTSREEASPR